MKHFYNAVFQVNYGQDNRRLSFQCTRIRLQPNARLQTKYLTDSIFQQLDKHMLTNNQMRGVKRSQNVNDLYDVIMYSTVQK